MATGMQNIDIKDFTTVGSVEGYDHVVLSLFNGTSAKMTVDLLCSVVSKGVVPSIGGDGNWYVGSEDTGVSAAGKTPVFRKGTASIEWKYGSEDDSSWKTLVALSELRLKYDDLTDEQKDSLRLDFDDLSEEDIAELQRPANDMIAVLETTDKKMSEAEAGRVSAETERQEAEKARSDAEAARSLSESVREDAERERQEAESSRVSNEAARVSSETQRRNAEDLRVSAEQERVSNEQSRMSRESARVQAESARASAESSRESAENSRSNEFIRLKSESEAATASAQDTADHPTYIGDDYYVYRWNKETKSYDKTDVFVRGDAFSIRKVYPSVDEMNSDTSAQFNAGDLCLINTGDVEVPENAQLFVRNASGGWDFLVDLSGAVGFTGKTPQLFVGTVSVGEGKDSAAVALSPDGTDADGNPKFRVNYVIPCLSYEDLTEEQIAQLQQPANDMITRLQSTEDSVKTAEALRVSAEDARENNEQSRVSSESIRNDAEQSRIEGEELRSSNEQSRIREEDARQAAEQERSVSEAGRAEAETIRQEAEAGRELSEQLRKEDYESIKQDLITSGKIVVVPESEYEDAFNTGAIDETKLYFAYEED